MAVSSQAQSVPEVEPPSRPLRDKTVSPFVSLMSCLAFQPVRRTTTRQWSSPRQFDFLEELQIIPVVQSEVLQTAHHLPLLLDVSGDEPLLVAGVSRALLRAPAVSPEGAWARGYLPLLLRCLPFSLDQRIDEKDGEHNLLLASQRLLERDEPGQHPILTPDGAPTPEVARITQLLIHAWGARTELMKALEPLLLADVFVPIPAPSPRGGALMRIDREAVGRLNSLRAPLLVSQTMFSAQLMFAMLFSSRHLPGELTLSLNQSVTAPALPVSDVRHTGLEFLNFSMDDSDMVPIDFASESSG